MEIETSARLHLSLIDLNGSEGRIDGGLGITLDKPSLNISCHENDGKTEIIFDDGLNIKEKEVYESKIIEASNRIKNYLNIDTEYGFEIKEIYPIHQGLGLGTQLALSVGQLIAKMNDSTFDVYQLAKIIHRGGTSGIGVHSFANGGFIVDGGHKKDIKSNFLPSSASIVSPPPLLARYDFPKKWNIILATPFSTRGSSGDDEINIFQSYTPVNLVDVEKICYLTLMKVMPAILENDLDSFGDGINKIQSLGFKSIERHLQTNKIQQIIDCFKENDIPCRGMSSFGSTCFGITDSNNKSLFKDLLEVMDNKGSVIKTNGKNHGAILKDR